MKWWQTGVIYQIYPRSFLDSTGNGIGDLPGVMQKLDYLQWLGVDAIWFSPTFPSPMADFGYDVADYTDVHPDFGTLDDFDALLQAAYKHGLRVLLDLVPNHTSDQHAWFQASRSSREDPKRDWYIWKDPKPDGSPPNNWLAFFGGSAWEFDEPTGQYYLHSFLKEQPDLNWRNPDVVEAMHNVIRFWLDRGVAGFRVDVLDFVLKDDQFRDDPPNPDYEPQWDVPRYSLKHEYSAYQPGVHDVARAMREVFESYGEGERPLIGEIHYGAPLEQVVAYYGQNNDEMTMPFNFWLITSSWRDRSPSAEEVQAFIDRYESLLASGQWPNWVMSNHDVARPVTRYGPQSRVYAMLLLTLRGTPFIYFGDEIGMANVEIPPEQQQDPFGIRVPGAGRDGGRTPMQWSAAPNAGFSPAGVTPWLPLADDYATHNVEAQREDPHSMLSLYRALLALRRETPALHRGSYTAIPDRPNGVIAYTRVHEDTRIGVVLNLTDAPKRPAITGEILISTHMDREKESFTELRPYEGVIVQL